MRTRFRFLLISVVLLTWIPSAAIVAAPGEVSRESPEVECSQYELAPDGSRRQTFDSFDPIGGIAALPPRIVTQLQPGDSARYCVGFQNRGADPINLTVEAVDITADAEGLPSSQREAVDRGASKWLDIPTRRIVDLASGDVAWLEVQVDVPDDALAGSSYASVLATGEAVAGSDGETRVQSIPSIASQLFFDIPGDAARQGEVTNIRSPRVVWWDGLDLGNLPVLDKLRGLGIATIRFSWSNTGAFTSDIGGNVQITSDVSDRSVARLPVAEQVVLAGSERDYEVTWDSGIPLLGRFTPVLEVRGDGGRVERHELDPIWVIPSWWYLLALALAIVIPLWVRRRNRRRYRDLLERVEAAETRGNDQDEDDDSDWE